jgi:hypothetical protein
MEVLDAIGSRYGTRPSALLGVTDEFMAFSIDLWALNAGRQLEAKLMREAQRRGKRGRN